MSELKGLQNLKEQLSNYKSMYNEYYRTLVSHYSTYSDRLLEMSPLLCALQASVVKTEAQIENAKKLNYPIHYYTIDGSAFKALNKRYSKINHARVADAYQKMILTTGSRYGMPKGLDHAYIAEYQSIDLAIWLYYFDPKWGRIKNSKNKMDWFKSFLIDPKFAVGDIVSIRKNAADGAVKYEYELGNGRGTILRTYHGNNDFRSKTFMILGEDNKKVGSYEKTYKPNANGGMRRYKVLPVGDTKVYWVMERSLKKNRSKAVKDAKKR